jgi:hypothetical protein
MHQPIAAQRLRNQHLTAAFRAEPADLVAHMGAVQAQEFPFAKWGLAQRLGRGRVDADIEEAFTQGRILRTHVLRPTWHFVAADDIRWMLDLTGPRVMRTVHSWTRREGIDGRTLRRAATLFERALAGGVTLTRAEFGERLRRAKIVASAAQMAFVTMYAELEGIVCSGPRRGRQFTYALVAERAPRARRMTADESLAELTRRYFTSHGPATIRDFVWWSGLTVAETRRGLEMTRANRRAVDGLDYWSIGDVRARPGATVHLLPIYDEYLVAYRDRVAVPHGPGTVGVAGGGVTFRHALVSGGEVAGTWNVRAGRHGWALAVTPMRRLSRAERDGVAVAAARFARFLGESIDLTFAG